ncbi:Pectate lyase-like protein, partial [Drosera capensis]
GWVAGRCRAVAELVAGLLEVDWGFDAAMDVRGGVGAVDLDVVRVMLFGASDSYTRQNHANHHSLEQLWPGTGTENAKMSTRFFHSEAIVSQGNRFIAPPNRFAKEVMKREYSPESEWKNWNGHQRTIR